MGCDCKVKCFDQCLDSCGPSKEVACYPPCEGFRLDGRDSCMFDLIAQEHLNVTGVEVEFFSLRRDQSTVDPLYGEAVEYVWEGPYKIIGHVEPPIQQPEVRQEGYRITAPLGITLSRLSLEQAGAPAPRESDIVGFWQLPYWWKELSTNRSSPIKATYFNVIQIEEDGFIHDSPIFTLYKISLTRNTEFTPERRLRNR